MHRRDLAVGLLCALALSFLGSGVVSSAPGSNVGFTVNIMPTFADPGTVFNATIFIQNQGDDPANTLSINGTVPVNTTFVSLAGGCCGQTLNLPPAGGTGPFTIFIPGTHNNGASTSYTLRLQVNCGAPFGTPIHVSATGSSLSPDPFPGNNTGTDSITVGSNTSACGGGGTPPVVPPTSGGQTDFAVRLIPDENLQGVDDLRQNWIACQQQGSANQFGAAFTDVPQNHPYYIFIQKLRELRITNGCGVCVPPNLLNGVLPVRDPVAGQIDLPYYNSNLFDEAGLSYPPFDVRDDRALCIDQAGLPSLGETFSYCPEAAAALLDRAGWTAGAPLISPGEIAAFLNAARQNQVFPPTPTLHLFNDVDALTNCGRNIGFYAPMYDVPANVVQYGPVSPINILPFMEKLFCGTTFGSQSVSQLALPLINENMISLNLGALGNGQGVLGSHCFKIAENESPRVGSLSVITKYALLNDRCTGDVVSGGLAINVPSGGIPPVNLFDSSCPIMGSIPQFLTVTNNGTATGDVLLNLQPGENSGFMDMFIEAAAGFAPLDPSGGVAPAGSLPPFLPATVAGSVTVTAAQVTTTVAGATASATSASGRGRAVNIAGLAPGQSARFLVFTAAPLPKVGQVTLFTATISSAQDSNPANNTTTLVAGLTGVQGAQSGAGKPVPPQIFQNPGAIGIVSQRPPRTPTPVTIR